MSRFVVAIIFAAVLVSAPLTEAWAELRAGQAALQRGEWQAAEKELKSAAAADASRAALSLAELYLLTGRPTEAAAAAGRAAAPPPLKSEGLRLAGEALAAAGKTSEAIKSLAPAVQADPRNSRARVELALLYRDTGQRQKVEQTLQFLLDEHASGAFEKAGSAQLTDLAVACRTLKMWQDANDLFRQAVEKDANNVRAQLEWGEMFLEKHKPTEAKASFQAVLKINPRHPQALLGMAKAQITGSYNAVAATALADKALVENPRLVGAMTLKAGLSLDDEQYVNAEKLLNGALAINPNDLEAHALMAASKYLQDDVPAFDSRWTLVKKINPFYGTFFVTVADYGVKAHRYREAVQLTERAIALEPDNEKALVALGTGYLRLGDEAKGLEKLRKAWEMDPFNVMNFNLLTLFEEVVPKNYESFTSGPFRFRVNRKEKGVLELYVPDIMQRAWDTFCKKYGFTPRAPITVELFTERQYYAVRTVGLPDLQAQGTCFGELITAMSPASGEANWEEVLWHELSHVFAIQLSNNRVPRWFTEGLSEYETNVARPEWKREHNREIFLSLRRGDIWSIADLSAAFTRPTRPNGVLLAYHQSSLVIHYLVETYGFPKIIEALKLYGQGKRDDAVLLAITGKTLPEVDAGFHKWLEQRLKPYAGSLLIDWQVYADLKARRAEAEAKPDDAPAQAAYAAALYVANEFTLARTTAEKAIGIDARNQLAHYVLAQAAMEAKDYPVARRGFSSILESGADSYGIRLAMGQIATAEEKLDEAIAHFQAAKKLDPDRGEPYKLLADLYRTRKDIPASLKEMRAYTLVEEHEYDPARATLDRLATEKDYASVVELAPRLIAIQPMDSYVHEQFGLALTATGKAPESIREFQAALAAGSRKPARVRVALGRAYLAMGDRKKAAEAAAAALKDEPGNADASALLKDAS